MRILSYCYLALVCLFLAVEFTAKSGAASAHIHTQHGKHKNGGSRERVEDGAYSPRDSSHYAGGEHHQEFDHEAILGE
jgi:hypothetical protein